MRFRLSRNSWLLPAVFLAGFFFSLLATPLYRQLVIWVAYEPYARLVFACDNAMRDHLLAKHHVANEPTVDSVRALEAAEVGLLDCQDYDRMRKRLIVWGLSENELAFMGLQAIEEKATSLHRVIEIHEIRY